MKLRNIAVAGIVWLSAIMVFGSPTRADGPHYKFDANDLPTYEITVETELPNVTKTTIGYLILHGTNTDATNGQITLNYAWGVKVFRSDANGQVTNNSYGSLQPMFSQTPSGNQVMIDPRGTVLEAGAAERDAELESGQGPAWSLLLQPLPASGQTSWSTERDLVLTHEERTQTPGAFGGPWGGGQQVTRVETPVKETITYTADPPNGNQLLIHRHYDLESLEKVGDTPIDSRVGDGIYAFDTAAGRIVSLAFTMTETFARRNLTVKVPITVKARLIPPDELASIKSELAASVSQQVEQQNSGYTLAEPAPDAEAQQIKQIMGLWHYQGGKGVDILDQMKGDANSGGDAARGADGIVTLNPGQMIATSQTFRPPVTFQIIALTNVNDTRIAYAADQIIFNWEMDHNQIRVDGGPANGRHKQGVGQLPANQWVGIELTVTQSAMIIHINGAEIYHEDADFSDINQALSITAHNGWVKLKSVKMIDQSGQQ
jgi:hypothetical protein